MAIPVIMPRQGQSVESCIIVSWKKHAGDAVKVGDILCEVETDKATFEVESPASGTLLKIFHEQGADVPVLTPIAAIGTPGENTDNFRNVGAGPSVPAEGPGIATAPVASSAPAKAAGDKLKASPRAKAFASAKGISLAGLRGTGPGGRILERDVQAAQRAQTAAVPLASPATVASGDVREVKLTGIRKLISERMLASLQTTAQLTMHAAADARSLQSMRKKFKESPEPMGLRDVTINDMLLYAVSRVLSQYTDLNALFSGDTLRIHAAVHLGFAVDTPKGLVVPVIRNAHALSLKDIARESARLVAGCRGGGVTPGELAGGTFTVTNLGTFGVLGFTPVLNAPQVGILGVGAIVPGPQLAEDGTVGFVPQIGLSLTINHQVVDGAPGARFLQALAAEISQFELLLAK
jgi:pyruvate dehydrogenase E2 component (dihydrolipoamide acetyltransferase)